MRYSDSILSETFSAAFYRNVDDIVIRTQKFEHISPEERLLHVDACGICGTDINAIICGSAKYLPLGHEVAGRRINEDGSLSEEPVVMESSSACGRCASCRNGRQDLCVDVQCFGKYAYFGVAQRMACPEISLVPYGGMEPAVACLSEPLGVAVDLCKVAEVDADSNVLVVGLGPIGLMALRLAKLAGAPKVYASTFSWREKRNAIALEFGADELLFEDEQTLAGRKLDPPPNRVLITAPPPAITSCVAPAANGAVLAYLGVGHGETDRFTLPANEFHFKKLQLRSSHASPALRTPIALELLRSKRVDGEKLITHKFPMRDAAEAIRVACLEKNETIKVVVTDSL